MALKHFSCDNYKKPFDITTHCTLKYTYTFTFIMCAAFPYFILFLPYFIKKIAYNPLSYYNDQL